MTRLAVSVHDELGVWNVAIMGVLLPSPGPGPGSRSPKLFVRPDQMVRVSRMVWSMGSRPVGPVRKVVMFMCGHSPGSMRGVLSS